jgi:hypothetical protein
MKLIHLALAATALACSASGLASSDYRPGTADIARTAHAFPKDDTLRFVVVGDRTGQHRPGVFEKALAQVDQLHPDFVINIGDLIEGNTEDRTRIDAEWKEVDGAINQLRMPFFYVPGNHDLTNEVQRQIWRQRLGADYYHFTYKNVLFLVLNTEDPPQPKIARRKLMDSYGAGGDGQGDARDAGRSCRGGGAIRPRSPACRTRRQTACVRKCRHQCRTGGDGPRRAGAQSTPAMDIRTDAPTGVESDLTRPSSRSKPC